MQDDIGPWVILSDGDLRAAEVLLASEQIQAVSFHCQQAVEKRLKALYVQTKGEMPPRTHTLPRIAAEIGLEADEAMRAFLVELTYGYIAYRYPTLDGALPEAQYEEDAERLLARTKEAVEWLDHLLK